MSFNYDFIERDFNREAFAWYSLVSPEYLQKAYRHLKKSSEFLHSKADEHPFIQGYAPVPYWLARMDELLDTFRNAQAMLEHGDYDSPSMWCGSLMGIPRGWDEGVLSWLTAEEQDYLKYGDLSDAARICGNFSLALRTSSNFSQQPVLDGEIDWRIFDEDQGYPGNKVLMRLEEIYPDLQPRIPIYGVDETVTCKTGDIVPWTGVWVPEDGMGTAALAFAIQGQIMQPAYEVYARDRSRYETRPLDKAWHPVKPTGEFLDTSADFRQGRIPAGQPCPQSGWWYTPAKVGSRRHFEEGEVFPRIEDSDYGETFWLWSPDQG